jgi:hypothetical protein
MLGPASFMVRIFPVGRAFLAKFAGFSKAKIAAAVQAVSVRRARLPGDSRKKSFHGFPLRCAEGFMPKKDLYALKKQE